MPHAVDDQVFSRVERPAAADEARVRRRDGQRQHRIGAEQGDAAALRDGGHSSHRRRERAAVAAEEKKQKERQKQTAAAALLDAQQGGDGTGGGGSNRLSVEPSTSRRGSPRLPAKAMWPSPTRTPGQPAACRSASPATA